MELSRVGKFSRLKDHDKAIEQAFANVIWFREEKDVEEILDLLRDETSTGLVNLNWQPELIKPYKLPEGLDIEILFDCCDLEEPCDCLHQHSMSICIFGKQFAFLKPKEQERSDDAYEEMLRS